MITIPIEISARHIHLSKSDLETLFGEGYSLKPIKQLSQFGQFACDEVVEVQNLQSWGVEAHMDFTFGKAPDHNQIRVLGPVRDQTQVELSWSDFIGLGLKPYIALSGELEFSSGGIIIIGFYGQKKLDKGVIIAQRHIHCSQEKARKYELKDGQIVSVKVVKDNLNQHDPEAINDQRSGVTVPTRQITFHNITVRVKPIFDWQLHIDTDEANAAGIIGAGLGELII